MNALNMWLTGLSSCCLKQNFNEDLGFADNFQMQKKCLTSISLTI